MADHRYRVPTQQINPTAANTYPHPALPQLHGQNPHVVHDNQQDVRRDDVPHHVGNVVVMQGEMPYPGHIDAPNYNAAHYYPPPPQYPDVPHWLVEAAEGVPAAQAHPFPPEPEVQVNHDGLYGYGAHFPAPGPPEDVPGVWPQPAPPADIPQVNFLRDLVGRFLNSPDTHVNVLRIERGPRGRFEVSIRLELANIP